MDKKKIENAVREILIAIGENPDREGLIETPKRVAKMYEEVFRGIQYSNEEIAKMFDKKFKQEGNDLVLVKDIPCFSYCEHHIALMYNMSINIAYIPNGYVLGLSKFARISDMVCKRLQLQERIGTDIADILEMILGTNDIAVVINGEHSCMTARGIKKPNTKTRTATLRGRFKENAELRNELYNLLSK